MDDQQQNDSAPTPVATKQKNSLAIPLAIILGFGLIAAAIFFSDFTSKTANLDVTGAINNADAPEEPTTGPIRPVDENDHIRGNPNAPIVIVEYSDYDCPFCKNFHETMNLIMDNYGSSGEVAWVYRHFPLVQLHPSAPLIAAASECVAKLGDNDAFWTFSDLIFSERETNAQTNTTRLNEFATKAGVDGAAFDACVASEETKPLVEEDYNDALNAGARGTPYSIISVGGQQGVINGAQPFDVVNQIVQNLLEQTAQ